MKKLVLITLLFSASLIYAQKTVATVKDSDELTLNVKKQTGSTTNNIDHPAAIHV